LCFTSLFLVLGRIFRVFGKIKKNQKYTNFNISLLTTKLKMIEFQFLQNKILMNLNIRNKKLYQNTLFGYCKEF